MYVCICNAYRDAEIREAARSGLRCAHKAYARSAADPAAAAACRLPRS